MLSQMVGREPSIVNVCVGWTTNEHYIHCMLFDIHHIHKQIDHQWIFSLCLLSCNDYPHKNILLFQKEEDYALLQELKGLYFQWNDQKLAKVTEFEFAENVKMLPWSGSAHRFYQPGPTINEKNLCGKVSVSVSVCV